MENKLKLTVQKGKLKEVVGSPLQPVTSELSFIPCITELSFESKESKPNDLLDRMNAKWKSVKSHQKAFWINRTGAYKLGAVFEHFVQSDVRILFLLCRDKEVNEPAFHECCKNLAKVVKNERGSVHFDSTFKSLSNFKSCVDYLIDSGLNVYIYSPENKVETKK